MFKILCLFQRQKRCEQVFLVSICKTFLGEERETSDEVYLGFPEIDSLRRKGEIKDVVVLFLECSLYAVQYSRCGLSIQFVHRYPTCTCHFNHLRHVYISFSV